MPREDWTNSTLAERLEEAARRLQPSMPEIIKADGTPAVNKMADLVGVEGGPMSRYMSKKPPKPGAKPKGATPELFWQMSQKLKVSYRWLAVGVGQPSDPDAPLSALDLAIAYLDETVPPLAVKRARAEEAKGVVKTPREWGAWMLHEARELTNEEGQASTMRARVRREPPTVAEPRKRAGSR